MFKPKVKEMNWFLKLILKDNISGITLAPFGIYLRKQYLTSKPTINHESIHWRQQLEMLIIFFYFWYLIEWFIKLFKYGTNAYYQISFEKEAYGSEYNFDYLNNRNPYQWFRRILK